MVCRCRAATPCLHALAAERVCAAVEPWTGAWRAAPRML